MKHIFLIKYKNKGFTLIELMVSSAIFLLIIVMGVGVILSVNKSYKVKQFTREQLDTMTFIMEDMTRNIRSGTNIHCFTLGAPGDIEVPYSCTSSNPPDGYQASTMIALEGLEGQSGDPNDQIVYSFDQSLNTITKSTQGYDPALAQKLVPSSVSLDFSRSGFTVFGAEPNILGDTRQPFVIIRIVGTVTYEDIVTPFNLQTAVTVRTLDI